MLSEEYIRAFVTEKLDALSSNDWEICINCAKKAIGPDSYYHFSYTTYIDSNDWGAYLYLAKILGCEWVRTGASKCVMYWPELGDIVIKIPFEGRGIFDYDTYEFIRFESELNYDYCHIEADKYTKADGYGIGDFFCGTEYLMHYRGVGIYFSEYADNNNNSPRVSEGSEKKARAVKNSRDYDTYEFDEETLSIFFEQHDEEDVLRFLRFISDEDINDLHDMNYGYVKGKLKLIDYSGYKQ